MKEWFKKLMEAMSKPEAERAAAMAALGEPPEATPPTGGTTPPTGGATPPASGNAEVQELKQFINALKAQNDQLLATITEMKKQSDDQNAALTAEAKKQLDAKVAAKIEEGKKLGRIAAKDDATEGYWKKALETDFDAASKVFDAIPAKTPQQSSNTNTGSTSTQSTAPATGLDLRRAAAEAFASSN